MCVNQRLLGCGLPVVIRSDKFLGVGVREVGAVREGGLPGCLQKRLAGEGRNWINSRCCDVFATVGFVNLGAVVQHCSGCGSGCALGICSDMSNNSLKLSVQG